MVRSPAVGGLRQLAKSVTFQMMISTMITAIINTLLPTNHFIFVAPPSTCLLRALSQPVSGLCSSGQKTQEC